MIKYLLATIALLLVVLVSYTQLNEEKTIDKNNSTSIDKKTKGLDTTPKKRQKKEILENQTKAVPSHTAETFHANEASSFDKEMAENEKEIIRAFLKEKETLSKTYNLDEEENVPSELTSSQSNEEYDDISLEEVDKIEKENNLQPVVVNMPDIQEDTPMTSDELEKIEASAGLQDILEDNSEPLDKEDIPF